MCVTLHQQLYLTSSDLQQQQGIREQIKKLK